MKHNSTKPKLLRCPFDVLTHFLALTSLTFELSSFSFCFSDFYHFKSCPLYFIVDFLLLWLSCSWVKLSSFFHFDLSLFDFFLLFDLLPFWPCIYMTFDIWLLTILTLNLPFGNWFSFCFLVYFCSFTERDTWSLVLMGAKLWPVHGPPRLTVIWAQILCSTTEWITKKKAAS